MKAKKKINKINNSIKSALVGKIVAPVDTLSLTLGDGFILEMLLDVLTGAVGIGQMPGPVASGRRGPSRGHDAHRAALEALGHVRAPIQPLTQEIFGPTL